MEKNWFMNIVSKKQYLENPCGTLSVPYWKANCTTVPDHMKILHHREFYPELLDKYFDEPYFRLQHHLQEVDSVSMPDGYSLYKATIPEFAEHINKCYKDVCLSVSELQSYIAQNCGWLSRTLIQEKLWQLVLLNWMRRSVKVY